MLHSHMSSTIPPQRILVASPFEQRQEACNHMIRVPFHIMPRLRYINIDRTTSIYHNLLHAVIHIDRNYILRLYNGKQYEVIHKL